MDGIPSKQRDPSIDDNLGRLAEMTKGSVEGQRWCIRAKVSVDDPNKALRDPAIDRRRSCSFVTWTLFQAADLTWRDK